MWRAAGSTISAISCTLQTRAFLRSTCNLSIAGFELIILGSFVNERQLYFLWEQAAARRRQEPGPRCRDDASDSGTVNSSHGTVVEELHAGSQAAAEASSGHQPLIEEPDDADYRRASRGARETPRLCIRLDWLQTACNKSSY